jgi:kumamolisin
MTTTRSIARTSRRLLPAVLAVGVTAVLLASQGTTAVAAAAPATGPLVAVAQGSDTAPLSNGTPLGSTPPNTPVDLSFVLKARNLGFLQSRVQAGWNGPYLTTQQFAAQYGQSPSVIQNLESYLNGFGITTSAYSDGLDISANGTAGQFNKALGVSLKNFRVKAPNGSGGPRQETVFGSLSDPLLPPQLGSQVLAILGLSNYSPFVSHAVAAKPQAPAAPGVQSEIAQAATAPSATTPLPTGELSPFDFVNRYKLSSLEAGGAKGQGETIGIVTLATIDPSVPRAFWNTYLGLNEPASRLKLIPIDGGAPGVSLAAGSDETDLDVEQSGAIAPAANVRVYEAPNTDPGFADAFFAAASDNIADTVSTSWGESESYVQQTVAQHTETPAYAAVFDEAFAELAAQGQSDFASSGDSGAYDATGDVGSTNLAVDTPADSPYITAAGGTTLPGVQTYGVTDAGGNLTSTESVNIPTERAWSWDYLFPLYQALGFPDEATDALALVAGDGGGYSVLEPRPSYQNLSPFFNDRQYLTPTTPTQVAPGLTLPTGFNFNPNPRLASGVQFSGRALPDVSTNADPQTGYAVYDPTLFDGGFAQYGGTSFVSPQLNGSTAVIDSYLGHRVGLWNPSIYSFANGFRSPFTPLNDTTVYSGKNYIFQTTLQGVSTALPGVFSNNNLYYTGEPGSSWNPASGLGIPNLTALAQDFAR